MLRFGLAVLGLDGAASVFALVAALVDLVVFRAAVRVAMPEPLHYFYAGLSGYYSKAAYQAASVYSSERKGKDPSWVRLVAKKTQLKAHDHIRTLQ